MHRGEKKTASVMRALVDKADLIKNSASQTLFSQSNNGEKERINRNITNQKNHQ